MCELACNETSTWLMVDPWEAVQPDYQPTAVVLDHIAYEINSVLSGIPTPSGSRKVARVMLLGGSDLLQTMSQPGVWSFSDLSHILGSYGIFVIERSGSDISDALAPLKEWSEHAGKDWTSNIHVIRQLIANDISSTRIRQFLRQGMSVQYLLPQCVIEYIREHGLYKEHEGFKETRSSSMPPLCRQDGKGKLAARSCLWVPEAAGGRSLSVQREPTKLREEVAVDDVNVDDIRGRRPS